MSTGSPRMGRGASFGVNCTVVCGHDVGEYAFIVAGAVLTQDVPAYALMVGNPARRLGWICTFSFPGLVPIEQVAETAGSPPPAAKEQTPTSLTKKVGKLPSVPPALLVYSPHRLQRAAAFGQS